MSRRLRPLAVAIVAAAYLGPLTHSASAWVTTDVSWSLNESWKTYGGGTQFHISQDGDGTAAYRWLDGDLTKTTVISGNSCGDYGLFGKSTFGGGDTSYHTLFSSLAGQCFVLRGQTVSGTTIVHAGRVRR
jgi:hypothetical protein